MRRARRGFAGLAILMAVTIAGMASTPVSAAPSGVADGTWSRLLSGQFPDRRYSPAVAVSVVDDRLFLFGGNFDRGEPSAEQTTYGDTWALSLASGAEWIPLQPSAAPPARYRALMVADRQRRRMLLFGGLRAGTSYNDVWALSGPPGDTAATGFTWQPLATAGTAPSPRFAMAGVYDAAHDRLLIFGGCDGYNMLQDVWVLSLSGTPTWTKLTPAGTPPRGRYGHSAVLDVAGDRMIVFGGWAAENYDSPSPTMSNEVWSLSLGGAPAWTQITPAGTPPAGRFFHGAAFDSAGQSMCVLGGSVRGGGDFQQRWRLDLAGTPQWVSLAPTSGAGIYLPVFVDPTRRRLLAPVRIAAGLSPWRLALDAGPADQPPPNAPLDLHGLFYDPLNERLIGLLSAAPAFWTLPLNTAYRWETAAGQGNSYSLGQAPSLSYQPWTLYTLDQAGQADPFALNLTNGAWSRANATSGTYPFPHGNVWSAIVEGKGLLAYLGDQRTTWALDLAARLWTQLNVAGPDYPPRRVGFAAAFDARRRRAIVFGGASTTGGPDLNDVWTLNVDDDPTSWSLLIPAGTPPPAGSGYAAVFDDAFDRVVVVRDERAWELAFTPAPAWRELTLEGGGPAVKPWTSVGYDPVRNRLFSAGRFTSNDDRDVWMLQLQQSSLQVAANVLSAGANLSRARIEWSIVGGSDSLRVWKTEQPGAPAPLAWASLPRPTLTITDSLVARGKTYDYELRYQGATLAPTSLRVPLLDEVATVVAAGATPTQASLEWSLGDNAGLPVNVERRAATEGAFSVLGADTVDAGGGVQWTDAGVVAGTTYTYRLRSGTDAGGDTTFLVPEQSVTAQVVSAGANLSRALVVWATNADTTSFDVERGVNGAAPAPYEFRRTDGSGGLALADSSVARGDRYVYQLRLGGVAFAPSAEVRVPLAAEVIQVARVELAPNRVRVEWSAVDNPWLPVAVERREDQGAWLPFANLLADAAGRIVLVDDTVAPGQFLSYRIVSGGEVAAVTSAVVPGDARPALGAVLPSPARGRMSVELVLSSARGARLELFDLQGRRVLDTPLDGLGAGVHTVDLAPPADVRAGVYSLVFTQGETAAHRKVVLLR